MLWASNYKNTATFVACSRLSVIGGLKKSGRATSGVWSDLSFFPTRPHSLPACFFQSFTDREPGTGYNFRWPNFLNCDVFHPWAVLSTDACRGHARCEKILDQFQTDYREFDLKNARCDTKNARCRTIHT